MKSKLVCDFQHKWLGEQWSYHSLLLTFYMEGSKNGLVAAEEGKERGWCPYLSLGSSAPINCCKMSQTKA